VSLSTAIKQYISSKYDQHPDMFTRDLEVIDQIRNDAINVREPHVSGVRKLLVYTAQLVWMSGKFPTDVSFHFHLDAFAENPNKTALQKEIYRN
jgi:programmed cell death 6-interacting protein